ncbi:MAG: ABC-type transport auxiliary lipoprotein family protein [Pseudomonadota bacterium]|nr:ABC-type transport auxiliary lipoprotein family protein [Pseudomonadota bacterium]
MKHPRSGRRWISTLGAAALMMGLAGCTPEVLKNEAPAISTYVLDAGIDSRPQAGTGRGVLVVALPNAQPGFDTQYIAYTREPLAIDYYTKSQWADTPARMLLPLVVRAMEASGLFRAVVVPPTPASGDLRLEVDIIRLQHEFYDRPSQVRLTVRAKLFDVATSHVLATQLFEAGEPAASEDAYGGVQAANQAVRRILGELVDFVAASRSAARR